MSFNAGAITGSVELDVSPFDQAIARVVSETNRVPTAVKNGIDAPLASAEGHMKRTAGEAEHMGGSIESAGNSSKGILQMLLSGFEGMSGGAIAATAALGAMALALGAAAAAAAFAAKAFMDTAHWADAIGDSAASLGVSTEFLSGMARVAQDAGVSMEEFSQTIKFMEKNAWEALHGNEALQKSFASIGISMEDLQNGVKNPEALFFKLADAMSKIETPAQRTAVAMDLLGRGGDSMVGLFKGGSAEMQEFEKTIAELGGTVSQKTADMADKWGKLEVMIGAAWDGIKATIAEPILEFVSEHWDEIVETIKSLTRDMKDTIVAGWPAIRAVLEGMLELFKALADIMGVVADAAVAINNAFGGSAIRHTAAMADAAATDIAARKAQKSVNAKTDDGGRTISIQVSVDRGQDADEAGRMVREAIEAYDSKRMVARGFA